ncbi:MAG TPA: hypothetical protein VFP08_05030 [Acidimicrobiales bacterium]|nr:hypothetical protein [Acidimicrobiales bacterium]
MAGAIGRDDELPLYVGNEVDDGEVDETRAARAHPTALTRLAAAGRMARELSEHMAGGEPPPPAGEPVLRGSVLHITRHLPMAAPAASGLFDRWLASSSGAIDTRYGHLRLSEPVPPGRGRLRVLPGRLSLRMSAVPLSVELELLSWGAWRSALTLVPGRRFGWAVGPHRRSRWFSSGHAVMDVLVHDLRALVDGGRGQPYDAPSCGRWSSSPTPAGTA